MTPTELQPFIERHGGNKKAFAEVFGVTRDTVARWLKGETDIPLMLQWALAAAEAGLEPVGTVEPPVPLQPKPKEPAPLGKAIWPKERA